MDNITDSILMGVYKELVYNKWLMNIRQEMNTHGLNYIWNLSYLDNRVHSMIKERMLDTFKQLCPSKVTTTLKGIPHQHLLIEFKLQTTIIKNCFNTSWKKRMNVGKREGLSRSTGQNTASNHL